MTRIAALYIETGGCYDRREGQDPYPQRHAGAVPRHSDRHGAIRRREGR